MKGQFKKRMDEINRMYPKAARPSSGRANRDSAAKDRSKQKRREEEKKNEERGAVEAGREGVRIDSRVAHLRRDR